MDEAQLARLLAARDVLEGAEPESEPRPQSEGIFSDLLIGAGEAIGSRLEPYFPSFPGPAAGMRAPDTIAGSIGKGLPLAAVSALAPATGLAGIGVQGLLGAGYEALDPESTPGSIIGAGASGAAATGVFDLGSRAVGGMARRVLATIADRAGIARRGIMRTQSETLRTLSETLGGLGVFNRQQQTVVNRAAVEAIGETGDSVAPLIRRQAAQRIGRGMDAALPTGPVDVTAAFTVLDDIPADVLPGKSRLLEMLQKAETNRQAYQDVARQLRDTGRKMARSPDAAFADELYRALDELTTAGEAAGAVNTRELREQWKNLVMLESIPAVRRTGQVPALSAEGAIFRSYGGNTSREAGQGTLPATQRFIEITQAAAEEAALRFKSSGTGERMVQAGAAQDALGLLTGSTSPSAVARSLGSVALAGPVLGAAAVGPKSQAAGVAGAVTGQAIVDRAKKRRKAGE